MPSQRLNPWKTLSTEKIYDSPWIDLTKHNVINPGGKPGTYSVVHFKNYAIGIIPLDDQYNTWIVGQYRYPIQQYTWEMPEGGGKLDIPPLESAKRELLEECGITATKWTKIQEMHLSNSASDEFCILYVAQDLSFTDPIPDENEKLELKKISFDELYSMVLNGEITDCLTVTAALRVKIMLDGGEI